MRLRILGKNAGELKSGGSLRRRKISVAGTSRRATLSSAEALQGGLPMPRFGSTQSISCYVVLLLVTHFTQAQDLAPPPRALPSAQSPTEDPPTSLPPSQSLAPACALPCSTSMCGGSSQPTIVIHMQKPDVV